MKHSLLILVTALLSLSLANCSNQKWYETSRDSAGIAPDPVDTEQAVIHVYGADTFGWRGWFAIHTWIAAKRQGESEYTVYDVVGWRGGRGAPVVRIVQDIPDRFWYGEKPELLKEHVGDGVEQLIDAVDEAARTYPWKNTYKAFPGPNSNTFTAWIASQVPKLELDLPFSAIGSGYASHSE